MALGDRKGSRKCDLSWEGGIVGDICGAKDGAVARLGACPPVTIDEVLIWRDGFVHRRAEHVLGGDGAP
jgi:hypothetical protein